MTDSGNDSLIWNVYLLECADGTLYCGITRNLQRRLAQHNGVLKGGARYTRGRRPVILAGVFACANRSEALKAECAIKSLPRQEKLLCFKKKVNLDAGL